MNALKFSRGVFIFSRNFQLNEAVFNWRLWSEHSSLLTGSHKHWTRLHTATHNTQTLLHELPLLIWDFLFVCWCNRITADTHTNPITRRHNSLPDQGPCEEVSDTDLDDLVLRSKAGSLCRRVIVHGSDELAWSGLLAVQVEAVAAGAFLQVAEPRPRPPPLLLHTQTHTWQNKHEKTT